MNLLSLYIFWLLTVVAGSSPDCPPRRYVSHHEANATRFNEDGVFNYSTMLLREDLGLLMLGARETVFALDLNNISTKRALVRWEVTEAEKMDCQNKGKGPEDCKNYIKILHKMADNRMFVCGTRGFAPQCAYMTFSDGILTLQNNRLEGTEKCPHDPDKSFASLMDNNTLYTAVYRNFRGTEPLLSRHPDTISSYNIRLRTETSLSIFKEPTFASMAQISQSGKVYLFFGEKPVECDCFNKMAVSRVARVCKGDQGGQNILQNRWTSFLKARIDCPVQNSQLPYIIQDTYLWCDPQQQSSGCLFYGIFTPQSNTSDTSAVCVYRVSDIDRRFAEGDYKTKGTVSTTTFTKWIKNTGVVPSPRPGACINTSTRLLRDQTLEFVRANPLMDMAIQPVGQRPLLVRRGTIFTHIIVNMVEAADGNNYHVMFIGTEGGTMLKAVNYDGEMFIIEEIQLFNQAPIKSLKISHVTHQLYAGSDSGAAQIPLASCERSPSCMDCVLARDPYCGWDIVVGRCVAVYNSQRGLIQSVQEGNASLCPSADPIKPTLQSTWPGGNLMLSCPPPSNLAKTWWEHDSSSVILSDRVQQLKDKLLILGVLESDGGLYRCLAVESSKSSEHTTAVAEYQLSVTPVEHCVSQWNQCLGILVPVVILLFVILAWDFHKGHLSLPCKCQTQNRATSPT
ncbi:semaphorin-4E-like [Solea senegalensis]|uniref:Semaphorin-4E-like n=1 Tax=Solea senegalensis TaxID=28829 RepID=A0AAV6QXR0_SOLSE|nr:semaphorin-4E-like [Solea senegalensis]